MSDTIQKQVVQRVPITEPQQLHAKAHLLVSRYRSLDGWSLALYGILGLAAFLRFYRLDASSLWSDEGNSWAQLDRSLIDIARAAAADIHPPGYYWLLKGWTTLFGTDASGMRSFSATVGVLLIWVIYQISRLLFQSAPSENPKSKIQNPKSIALLAALLAALNPFQVYYSQEARMYMLLALESAGLIWATLRLMQPSTPADAPTQRRLLLPATLYVLCAVVGLWTHYSFPLVLAAAGIGLAAYLIVHAPFKLRPLLRFAGLNGLALLCFSPWLTIAVERVLAWPKGGADVGLVDSLRLTLQTLLFGPLRSLPTPEWPWLLAAGLLPLAGLWRLRRRPGGWLLALWLLSPILLMVGLGLYSDAFLKFLLIASPAWSIAMAGSLALWPWASRLASLLLAFGALGLTLLTLPGYYTDPMVRDNYAGVARYLQAIGDPATDLVILDAPGQQEVWRYYERDYDLRLPTLALPQQRPPDPQQTLDTLRDEVAGRRQIYALFWATDEADPDGIVERWLGQQLFKGVESWQGNLRFVGYSAPTGLVWQPLSSPIRFGEQVELLGFDQTPTAQLAPGAVALVGLHWSAVQAMSTRYHISLQLLDSRNQVIAQQDGEPAGGTAPTDQWQPGQITVDNRGLLIPFGTPPGEYRLVTAVYDPATGVRLSSAQGDAAQVDTITVGRRAEPVPLEIVTMQHRADRQLGPVILAGYDLYRKGFAHAPEISVAVGDLLHLTLYWQAPDPLPADWPDDLQLTLQLGNQAITAPVAGGAYATGQWQPGELVRGEFDLPVDGSAWRPTLHVHGQSLRLSSLPR
jgi:mannosyltransferase